MKTAPLIGSAEALAVKRILIINVTRIGDTLLNTPAIRAIARHFPNAAITCLGHAKRVEVLNHLPYLTKVGEIDKRSALYRGRLGNLIGSFTGERYDWAFVWGHDEALHQYALRKADRVVGYAQKSEALNKRLYHAAIEPKLYSLHGVAMQLALPHSVGIVANDYGLDYVATGRELQAAKAQFARLTSEPGMNPKPLIGLQVASFPTKAYRDWPIEQFIALGVRVIKSYPHAHFCLFGGPDDRERTAIFKNLLPDNTTVYAGELSLRETAAIMHELDLYIGVDTGPTHLFGALGKPMVAMYHPTLPSSLYKPLQHPALYVVDHPLAGITADATVPMADITVDMVWERVADALSGVTSRFPGMAPAGIRL